jgi:hypothetical protein
VLILNSLPFAGVTELQAVSQPVRSRQVHAQCDHRSSEAVAVSNSVSCLFSYTVLPLCSDSTFGRESLAWMAQTLQVQAAATRREFGLSLMFVRRRPCRPFKQRVNQPRAAAVSSNEKKLLRRRLTPLLKSCLESSINKNQENKVTFNANFYF